MQQPETPYPQQQPEPVAQHVEDAPAYDCAIVGGGPAGLSAAIYVARYNRRPLVVDFGEGRSTSHETNENYLGFPAGVGAREIRELGRQQAARFGALFLDANVSDIQRRNGGFLVRTDAEEIAARSLILATGVIDIFPEIGDVEVYVGRSLFWCITCDGWKTRGKRTAVVGATDEAAATCMQFLDFTRDLVFLTNAPEGAAALAERSRANLARAGIAIVEGCITGVTGQGGMIRSIILTDGERIAADVMISQQGSLPNTALAGQLGVAFDGEYIKVDHEQRTNVPLVYAAGDVTKPFAHQVVTAAHEGATAAMSANYDLYRPEQKEV